jgi:hypothetical protein
VTTYLKTYLLLPNNPNITSEAVHESFTIALLGIGLAALGPLLRRK